MFVTTLRRLTPDGGLTAAAAARRRALTARRGRTRHLTGTSPLDEEVTANYHKV
ncbi:hypothetical protein ARTHRO9V_200122 [Arthrobacter sp. 9V]|nr:hypothetical protein ARTHRO9V_200122 [Arthrobacter sp. 9V]